MKVENPNYVDPMESQIDAYRALFVSYMDTVPTDQRFVTFDEIRDHFGKTADDFPDGKIAAILTAIGAKVTR